MVLLAIIPLYYWYMLQPFYKKLGKESRRVAELLSQLPKSVDVNGKQSVLNSSVADQFVVGMLCFCLHLFLLTAAWVSWSCCIT